MKLKLIVTKENGKKISPVLPKEIKNFLVDIDGTVGEDIPNEEPERMEDAKVYPDALAKVNQWLRKDTSLRFLLRAPKRIGKLLSVG